MSRFSCGIEIGRLVKYGFKLSYTKSSVAFYKQLLNLKTELEDRYVELLRMFDKHSSTLGDDVKREHKFISDLKGDLSLVIETWHQSEYIINKATIRNKL